MGGEPAASGPSRAEVDLSALRRNLRTLRRMAGGRRLIAVTKADAYGHGAVHVGRALESEGVDMLAVANLDEARELRAAGLRAPILVLQGVADEAEAAEAAELRLVPMVGRVAQIGQLDAVAARLRRPLEIHLEVDTGMGRLGLLPAEVGAALERLRRASGLELQGLATHMAETDDRDSPFNEIQRRRFAEVIATVRSAGHDPSWIHADNSAGIVRGPMPASTAVRPGLSLYGADPTLEGGRGLEPVMTVLTTVIHAKEVPAGTRVGYGGTYVTAGATRILTVPFGYADGLPRNVGGRYACGVRDRRLPIVGRVSMDLATIDAGPESDVDVGEEVLLFGRGPQQTIRVEELAAAAETIPYEILVRIGRRVGRMPGDG